MTQELTAHLFRDEFAQRQRILAAVERCWDLNQLRQFISNAHRRNVPAVRNAAFRRLAFVSQTNSNELYKAGQAALEVYKTRLTIGRCYAVKMCKFASILEEESAKALLLDMKDRAKYQEISQGLVDMGLGDLTMEMTIVRFEKVFGKKAAKKAREQLLAYGFKEVLEPVGDEL